MNSKTATKIKQRTNPKDVFITPMALALKAINECQKSLPEKAKKIDYWYDPFRNSAEGSYYSQFPPESPSCWAEITEGRDFFTFQPIRHHIIQKHARLIICSNPPYSMLDAVFQRCIDLNPVAINLLLGVNNLTARRMEMMENAGYKLTNLHMCKVYSWFGMSFICNWVKGAETSCLGYDRIVWRDEGEGEQKEKATVKELKKELKRLGLSTKGKKAELEERIVEYFKLLNINVTGVF